MLIGFLKQLLVICLFRRTRSFAIYALAARVSGKLKIQETEKEKERMCFSLHSGVSQL